MVVVCVVVLFLHIDQSAIFLYFTCPQNICSYVSNISVNVEKVQSFHQRIMHSTISQLMDETSTSKVWISIYNVCPVHPSWREQETPCDAMVGRKARMWTECRLWGQEMSTVEAWEEKGKMEETHQHKRLLIIQQFNHKAHKKTTSWSTRSSDVIRSKTPRDITYTYSHRRCKSGQWHEKKLWEYNNAKTKSEKIPFEMDIPRTLDWLSCGLLYI